MGKGLERQRKLDTIANQLQEQDILKDHEDSLKDLYFKVLDKAYGKSFWEAMLHREQSDVTRNQRQ